MFKMKIDILIVEIFIIIINFSHTYYREHSL
jgi:hypothetical protein